MKKNALVAFHARQVGLQDIFYLIFISIFFLKNVYNITIYVYIYIHI